MVDDLLSGILNPRAKRKEPTKKSPFEGHRDYKKEIVEIIDELEDAGHMFFTPEEIFEKAERRHISHEEAKDVFEDLVASGYIEEIHGSEEIYQKAKYKDFSPAFEDMPEW